MATAAQIHANRENAKKSTGPKTEAGKAKSSMNRLSHGFASSARFVKGEDPEEFYALLNELIAEHQPATPTQQILVEKMALNQWISLRATRLQPDVLFRSMDLLTKCLPILIRYATTADRAFHKAHEALLRAQKQTPKSEIGFESKKAPATAPAPLETAAAPNFAPPKAGMTAQMKPETNQVVQEISSSGR